jgi:hypothetical protein
MDRVYLFLIRNDVWIYIVSALGLVWYLTEFIRAQRTLRRAMFNLEKETATSSRNHSLSFLLFFAFVIGSVYYVNRNIAPNLPAQLLTPATPTPDVFATPLAPPTPLSTAAAEGEGIFAPVLAPTVTLPSTPGLESTAVISGTQTAGEAEASPTPFEVCIPELNITEPLNGSVAFQRVTFRGTANTGELHQYVIELEGPQTVGAWAPIMQEPANQPIVNGDLAQADLSTWEQGPYLVRLRALDAGGRELGFCQIQIILDN